MKRILIAMAATALALTSAFALAGCGSSESSKAESNSTVESKVEDVSKADAAPSAAAVSADDVNFTVNGATVELNSELETAVAGLGDPIEITSQLSCHGEGEDKTYTYDGFIVNSYPDANGTDRVLAGLPLYASFTLASNRVWKSSESPLGRKSAKTARDGES